MEGKSTGEIQYAIYKAAVKGEIDVIANCEGKLLSSFRTPDVGNTVVHLAVVHGQLEVVKRAVSLLPELLQQKNSNGSTPLHQAAAFGTEETIQLLISLLQSTSSSAPNFYLMEVNHEGETPFHVSLRSRNMAAAKVLLSYVQDNPEILVMKTNLLKETPLHLFVRFCAGDYFPPNGKLEDESNMESEQALFFQLVKANFLALFELDSKGFNPVIRAAQSGHVLLIYGMLLRYPLSMECKDLKERGILHHLRLSFTNKTDMDHTLYICESILKLPGVDDNLICSRDQDGNTPLHLAVLDRDLELTRLILERCVRALLRVSKELVMRIKNTQGKSAYDLVTSAPDIPQLLKNLMEQASKGKILNIELYVAATKLDVRVFTQHVPIPKEKDDDEDSDSNNDNDSGDDVDVDGDGGDGSGGDGGGDGGDGSGGGDDFNNVDDGGDGNNDDDGGDGNNDDDGGEFWSDKSLYGRNNSAFNDDSDDDSNDFNEIIAQYTDGDNYYLSQLESGKNILHITIQHHGKSYFANPNYSTYEPFIKEAIVRYPELMYQKNFNGDTPLHIAARLSSNFLILLEVSFKYWYTRKKDDQLNLDLLPPWKVKDRRGNTPIHEAARTDNLESLDSLMIFLTIRDQTDALSNVNESGETAFHLIARYVISEEAGYHGRLLHTKNYLKYLIAKCQIAGCMRDMDGLTPILRAAHCGQAELVGLFANSEFSRSVVMSDSSGRNVFHHLCNSGLSKAAEFKKLLEKFKFPEVAADLMVSQDDDGNTPLHLAIAGQNFGVARSLMEHYFEKEQSDFGRTIRALRGTRNKQGKSVMHLITCESGIPTYLKELIRKNGPEKIMDDKFYEAVTKGDVDYYDIQCATNTIFQEFDVMYRKSHDGNSVIHIALQHHQISFIKHLFEKDHLSLINLKDSKGDTPLHLAAGLQNDAAFSFLELCLNYWTQESVHYDDSDPPWALKNLKGNTYLHEAARLCNYKVIFSESLDGKDIKHVNDRGETVLHVIVRYATNKAMNFLENMSEQMKSLVHVQDLEGFTPVLRALQYGRIGVATLLIQQFPSIVEITDNKGGTVLHHLRALVVDFVDEVKDIFPVWNQFFKHPGVGDLRVAQNDDGNTPLHSAIIDGDFLKVKFLMERCLESKNKQELAIVNKEGHSVFDLISSQAHMPAMKELQSLMNKSYIKERELIDKVMDDELYRAAIIGNIQVFDGQIDFTTNDAESIPPILPEAYFCSQTPGGSNIVHIALRHGKAKVEEFIDTTLQKYPILSMRPDNNGDTPLHLAAKWKGGVSIVKLLIKASQEFLKDDNKKAFHVAPWAVKNYKGSFPIHEALQAGNLDAAKALLDCDSEAASRVNDLGDTPLHSFAENGFSISDDEADEFVAILLENYDRAVYMRDDKGLTPLLSAARSGRLQVAQAILKHCPQSAYLRDPCGRTYLHLLRFTGEDVDESLAGSFKNTGSQLFEIPEVDAQRLVQDYEGNTPLHYAIMNQNTVAAIVLTQRCLDDEEQRELGLINKEGQTIPDLLASHDVPNEIIELIRKKMPNAVYLARSSYGIRKTEMKESAYALSIVAALLATITFAAGLQVPGGFNEDNGSPVLLAKPAFSVFVVANTTAMCCSMLCLFLLLWVMGIGKIHGSLMILDISIILIRLSFYLTLLTFTMGVFMTIVKESLWLGIFVCVLGFLTFLLTWKISIRTVAKYGGYVHNSIKTFIKSVKCKCSQYKKVKDGSQPNRSLGRSLQMIRKGQNIVRSTAAAATQVHL